MQLNVLGLFLFCILLASCTTQPGKVEFPFNETEFKSPKIVKATPTIQQIPDSLPNAKYTTENGQLVARDQSIPLKNSMVKKASQPIITESGLKKHEIPANQQKHLAGIPKKVAAKGKTVPARGKVIKAGQPVSKPYMPLAVRDDDNFGIQFISRPKPARHIRLCHA